MRWFKCPYPLNAPYKNDEVWLNDDTINPPWFKYKTPFTDIHIRKGSKTLLIAVGDSWTYGQNLAGINCGLRYDLVTQIEQCWAPQIGLLTGIDVLQYARAGCSNVFIAMELNRLVKYAIDLNMYDQLLICYQMTDDSRDFLSSPDDWGDNHPLKSIITPSVIPKKEFKDWLCDYDDIFFKMYDDLLDYAKARIAVDAILSRNLTKISTSRSPINFRILPRTWIELTSFLEHRSLIAPHTWHPNPTDLDKRNATLHIDWAMHQLDLVHACIDFISGNSKMHHSHPNKLGHLVWAKYIIEYAGWSKFKLNP